jgi:uncharacterized protein (TIGR00369 family)
MGTVEELNEQPQPLAKLIGVEIVEADRSMVVGRLVVRPDICTTFDTLHGGAIMAFADTLGATGAFLNLPPGAGTTTMESKTNFIGAAKVGTVVTAVATPVHIGRSTSIWQTRIMREDGKLVAVVTQTQMVLT